MSQLVQISDDEKNEIKKQNKIAAKIRFNSIGSGASTTAFAQLFKEHSINLHKFWEWISDSNVLLALIICVIIVFLIICGIFMFKAFFPDGIPEAFKDDLDENIREDTDENEQNEAAKPVENAAKEETK